MAVLYGRTGSGREGRADDVQARDTAAPATDPFGQLVGVIVATREPIRLDRARFADDAYCAESSRIRVEALDLKRTARSPRLNQRRSAATTTASWIHVGSAKRSLAV